jgi:hypothetical protein
VLSCVGDHILQDFNTLYLTRFRTYKIALPPPQTKPIRGEEASDRYTPAAKSLYMSIFLGNDISALLSIGIIFLRIILYN